MPANNVLTQFGADCPVLAGESERMSIYNQICFEVPLSHNATEIYSLDSMKKINLGNFGFIAEKSIGSLFYQIKAYISVHKLLSVLCMKSICEPFFLKPI